MKKDPFRIILEDDHELADIMLEVQRFVRANGYKGLTAQQGLDFLIYNGIRELYGKKVADIMLLGYM